MFDINSDDYESVEAEIVDCPKVGRGPGRPRLKPTDDERNYVRNFARLGFSLEVIASSIRDGIDVDTLKRSFRLDLAAGRDEGARRVAETLMSRMTNPLIDCDNIRYKFLKHTAGYTDDTKSQLEHSTKNDKPLSIQVTYIKPNISNANS